MNHAGTITAIVSALVAIGSGISWWVKRRDTRSDPIPKGQAAVALADSAVDLANHTIAMVAADLANLKARVSAQDTQLAEMQQEHRAQGEEIAQLNRLVSALQTEKDNLVAHLRELWQWVIAGAHPPPPTAPEHLKGVLGEDFELARITEVSRTTTQTERIVYPEEQP